MIKMNKTSGNIIIRSFDEKNQEKVREILVDSFYRKFSHLIKLPKEKMSIFLKESGFSDSEAFDGYFVAEKDHSVVGVILLKWKGQKRKKSNGTPFLKLAKEYGFFRVIKFMIGAALLHEEVNEDECYIEHIAVDGEKRGMGIGTALLKFGENYAFKTLKKERFTLNVAAGNKGAYKLYKAFGFNPVHYQRSVLSQIFLDERKWFYMEKNQKTETGNQRIKPKYIMQKAWYLGFIGIVGIFRLPEVLSVFNGGDLRQLLSILWFLWFLFFLPVENKKRI